MRGYIVALLFILFAFPSDAATTLSNATVRVPRNMRVGVTVSNVVTSTTVITMETYVARVLNHEWFSTWGNYSGGMNSLKAGSAAIRSYSIRKLNNVATNTTYDICDTSACQVYGTSTSANANNAVSLTTGFVILGSDFSITNTEYSAENNSKGLTCSDGYTAPAAGCLFDPVCVGETRNGHGRGMCQWGSAKWATGLKMTSNGTLYPTNANSGLTNGYPQQNWDWIVLHYYPGHTLWQGTPLVEGDDVIASRTIQVRMNADGSISNATGKGMSAPFVATKAANSTGVIMTNSSNYIVVTNDGFSFTWYKVQWSDGTIGWSPENWLERDIPVPLAPYNLTATAVSTTQINLSWSDTNVTELGFEIQRSPLTNGNWSTLVDVSNVTTYADINLSPGTKYFYRIRAYNLAGNSSFSNNTNATTFGIPPTLTPVSNKTVVEGTLLTFTNSATAPDFDQPLNDFEAYAADTQVMFRPPNFSGSTGSYIDSAGANTAATTTNFPAGTNLETQVLGLAWSFTNTANTWLRLTTGGAANMPNPVIDFTKKLKFDIYTDRALKVALGCRETTNAAGTTLGSDGGVTGNIEWVGATNKIGTGPASLTTVTAASWQTISFNIPNDLKFGFTGNGVLSTASGLGVMEHLAFSPAAGTGAYNVYLDNFIIGTPKTLTYSLDPGFPTGASINSSNGVFTWTPTEAQGPGTYSITIRVTDNSAPPLSATNTFTVTVTETNAAPILTTIPNYSVHAGSLLNFTNSASDSDVPTNTLVFSLTNSPVGASINSSSGIFSWTPSDAFANTTNSVTVKVTDNGTPPLSNAKSFNVTVLPRPMLQSISVNGGNFTFNWSAISGKKYRVQYKTDLNDVNWTDLMDITANSSSATFSETAGPAQRFYRLIDLD